MTDTPNSYRTGPDERGHFGLYGGRFVAETLMPLILELEQAYEDAKAFNLSLLLPEEAQRNIDAATLFPFAYKGHGDADKYGFKPRLSIYPVLIGVPVVVVVGLALFYRLNISSTLQQIQSLVQ